MHMLGAESLAGGQWRGTWVLLGQFQLQVIETKESPYSLKSDNLKRREGESECTLSRKYEVLRSNQEAKIERREAY